MMGPYLRRAALVLAFVLAPATLDAQGQGASAVRDELARIRDAAALESSGDFAGAEKILRAVLAGNRTSLSALLGLERVYLVQGKLDSIVPYARRLLEADPGSAIAHQLLVRTYATLDRPEELERAADAWMDATPKIETPYREVARAWRQRNEARKALRVLQKGRDRVGTPAALALDLGDTYYAMGDVQRAVAEWDRAIGRDGQGFMLVQRRIRSLPDGGAQVVPHLLKALTRSPTTPQRQRGALQLALEGGLAREAEQIVRPLLALVPAADRESFLADVARRADGADLARIAYWAYDELIRRAEGDTVRLLALRTRLAQLALQVGDTTRAASAFAELERASARGSPQRRQAIAVRIRLSAREGRAMDAARELEAFRAEFTTAPELDETAAAVGEALLGAGELDAAERALLGVRGPRSALARGRTYLRRGDVRHATDELMTAAPALRGSEATRTIALAAALNRITPAAGELIARAIAKTREDAAGAIQELVETSHALPDRERGAVLDFAASLADDAGLADVAEGVRRELVKDIPRSDAAPAALLWLAQRAAGSTDHAEEARVLLEKLILEYPRSALVPHARRELDRISGRVPAEPAGRKAGEP